MCIAKGSPPLLRGRRGTMCTAKGSDVRPGVPLASLGLRRFCVAGVGQCALSRGRMYAPGFRWRPWVSASFAWQAWDNVHCQGVGCTPRGSAGVPGSPPLLRGRRGTMCTAKGSDVRPGVPLASLGLRLFCVAGMGECALSRGRMYAPGFRWRPWVSASFAWQAWDNVHCQGVQEAKMDVALKRWFDIISQFPAIHETVKPLHLLAGLAEQLRMLRDILSGKAPATLIKRANSMLKYIEKLREAKVQVPGDEPFLYAYFCDLRNSGVALSRLRSIVEAIRFTEFVFGIEGLSQKLLSKRCIGASRRVGETVLKQSDPFTVGQLAILHGVLHDSTALFGDRLVRGAALVAVYTRSRWMDMQHIDEVVMDPDPKDPVFVKLKIREFKTRNANAWRGGIMAAVGPALGVVQGNWVKTWWELRQQLGDQFGAGAPLMPAPDGEGTATVRPLSTGEFSKWVKMILDRNGGLQKDCRISSRSCKATMLSFLAKFGAPIPDREILGGHTGRMKSVLTYSRDSLASPLRVLTSMLERIRQGSFDPNATRSGMMKDVKVEVLSVEEDDEPWEPVERQQQDLDEEAGEDLGSGSDTSSSSEEEQAAVTHAARIVSAPKAPAGTELRQHPKSRMLHLIQEDHKLYLLCGRKVEMTNGSLYKPPASLRWDTPCCSHCWRASNTPLTSRLR